MGAKKVLIVEDDSTLATALAAAVKKAGYESLVCRRPDEALEALDREPFKLVFIDCLLPQTPGVEVAKTIRQSFDSKILPIVMMSGIFTDKQMMKDVTHEVSALDFLKKPFEVNEVLKFLEKDSHSSGDAKLEKSLFSLPDRLGANPLKNTSILNEIKQLNGFEIPILISSLIDNSFSGYVHLKSNQGEFSKVCFNRGHIISVESSDSQSFLGKLLVTNGWVIVEDLERELNKPSDKKLGQRLVEENLISPHAVGDVMEKQMGLRMESMIQDRVFSVQFEEKNIESFDDSSIDPEEFYLILDHWISKKVSDEWLAIQISQWLDYSIRLGPGHDPARREYEVNTIKAIPGLHSMLEAGGMLASVQNVNKSHLKEFNKAFYYMLCFRFVLISEKSNMSEAERFIRLQKMWSQIKDMNLIEVFLFMGGQRNSTPEETQVVYNSFSQKYLGPVATHDPKSPALIILNELKGKVDLAYNLFLDLKKVTQYERELEAGKVSQRSDAQAKLEEAKKFLSLRQYSTALILVNKASELFPDLDYLSLYKVWSKVGLIAKSKNKALELSEIDQILTTTPNEEKNTSIGNFVMGLVAKAKGEIAMARKCFENALAADKSFIEARRELNSIPAADEKKPVDLLHGDLSQVMRQIFKKS